MSGRGARAGRAPYRHVAAFLFGLLGAGLSGTGEGAAQLAAPPAVEEVQLSRDAFATGLLTPATGALPASLWAGADAGQLEALLAFAPSRPASPSLGRFMRRLLLSPGAGPSAVQSDVQSQGVQSLGGRKLMALARAGFVEEARTIASLSSASAGDPWVNRSLAVADLLAGDVAGACRRESRLSSGRGALDWVKLRVLCHAAAEEYDAADLTLGILRDQGALTETDEALLTAASIPAPLKKPAEIETALHFAALRQIGGAVSPSAMEKLDAGVLKALAQDAETDERTRLAAAAAAAAMGVLSAEELAAVYGAATIDDEDIPRARAAVAGDMADPLTDALVLRAVRQMQAPEFVRDKAGLIAGAINGAPDFARGYAATLLYAEDVKTLEGVIVAPVEAGAFALASMAAGDGETAQRWLLVMLGGGLSSMDEPTAMRFVDLANLLGVLDPEKAEALAAAATVALQPPRPSPGLAGAAAEDRVMFARLVEAAFAGAANDAVGQSGLAALALSGGGFAGDPVADVVAAASLRAAGFGDVLRRHEFETAWRASYPDAPAFASSDRAARPRRREDGLLPRLKPGRGR